MSVFVDTSALYAILDTDDENHEKAGDLWKDLVAQEAQLVSSNYVLLETLSLVQHRLGIRAVRSLQEQGIPLLHVEWVDESCHRDGVTAMLTAARRQLSLVDCVSFQIMRQLGIRTAFSFDRHFEEQGFERIPLI